MTGKRALDVKRARSKERDLKQQRLAGEVVEISSDEDDEEFVRVPLAADKPELFRVLNAFQSSPGFGIYVCEQFRDPRHEHIDEYFHEVQESALGISDLCRCLGKPHTPLQDAARGRMLCFAHVLESLARRTRAALAAKDGSE